MQTTIMDVLTVKDLIAQLSEYPPDTVVILTSDHINGAWSNITTNPCKVHLHSEYYQGFHKVFEDDGYWDNTFEIEDYLEDYPDATLVDGVHIT